MEKSFAAIQFKLPLIGPFTILYTSIGFIVIKIGKIRAFELLTNGFIALGTVGAVVMAVWHDFIENYLNRPKLTMEFKKQHGCLQRYNDVVFIRLIIHNFGKSNAKETQVIIDQGYCFDDVSKNPQISSGLRLTWTHLQPPENSEAIVFKNSYRFIDFGYFLKENAENFLRLTTDITPITFDNKLALDQRIHRSYVLTLAGDNFETEKYSLELQISLGDHDVFSDLRHLLDDAVFSLKLSRLTPDRKVSEMNKPKA